MSYYTCLASDTPQVAPISRCLGPFVNNFDSDVRTAPAHSRMSHTVQGTNYTSGVLYRQIRYSRHIHGLDLRLSWCPRGLVAWCPADMWCTLQYAAGRVGNSDKVLCDGRIVRGMSKVVPGRSCCRANESEPPREGLEKLSPALVGLLNLRLPTASHPIFYCVRTQVNSTIGLGLHRMAIGMETTSSPPSRCTFALFAARVSHPRCCRASPS